MATLDREEYKFPDEVESGNKKVSVEEDDDNIIIEVEDDTPPEDRNRTPLPKEVMQEVEQDELEEYSDKAKARLKQLKKVWHDERREKERAFREQNEAIRVAQQILEENKRLKQTLSVGEREYISTIQFAADTEMEMVKRQYREAMESGDPDKIVAAQESLTQASIRADKAKNFRPTLQNTEVDVKLPSTQRQAQAPAPDPKYIDWVERNDSWFQKDPEMTQAAFGLHEKLAQQYGQQYIGTDDYYQRIEKTIRKRFPEAFQNSALDDEDTADSKPQRKTSTVVASARRSTSPKSVKLTATQVALAKRLKLTPEQYVKELLKLENR